MNKYSFELAEFNNIGFITTQLSDEQLKPLRDEVDEIIKNNFNGSKKANIQLAGNIEHEYELPKSMNHMSSIILPLVMEYEKRWGVLSAEQMLTQDVPLKLFSLWVNFQKKHEFNPPHTHKGIMSFVLWLDIPYDIKDEINTTSSRDSAVKIPGHFQFLYIDSIGNIRTCNLPVDKTWNGKMAVFPAKMNHAVYPFSTSDDYRITISGNIKFLTGPVVPFP